MRTRIKKIIGITILFALSLNMPVFSDNSQNNISVTLNGTKLSMAVQPQMIKDRTMIPLRFVFEALGADVYWDDETLRGFQIIAAVKNNKKIIMAIEEYKFYKFTGNNIAGFAEESESVHLDVPPFIIDNITFIPIRAVCEAFDMTVDWEENTNTVRLSCSPDFINEKENDTFLKDHLKDLLKDEYFSGGFSPFVEIVYETPDVHADVMIVANETDPVPQACVINTNPDEIHAFLNAYQWHDYHIHCVPDSDAPHCTANFIYGDQQKESFFYRNDWLTLPYNSALNAKLKDVMESFYQQTEFSYRYFITAPLSVDYTALKEKLLDKDALYVYSHLAESDSPKHPYLTLEYQAYEKDYAHIKDISSVSTDEHELGEFEPDNIFIPFIDSLKEDGLYFSNNTPNFASSVSGQRIDNFFNRRITVYLQKPLDEQTVTNYTQRWPGSLEYSLPETYQFAMITDHILSAREVETIQNNYNIVIQEQPEKK